MLGAQIQAYKKAGSHYITTQEVRTEIDSGTPPEGWWLQTACLSWSEFFKASGRFEWRWPLAGVGRHGNLQVIGELSTKLLVFLSLSVQSTKTPSSAFMSI